jgi:hypothetical protein
MTKRRDLRARRNAPAAAALALTLALTFGAGLTARPARAQNEPPPAAGEGDKGRPLDGYIATGCLVGLALFLVAKSARRQTGR